MLWLLLEFLGLIENINLCFKQRVLIFLYRLHGKMMASNIVS